ncbi:unnamed protein product [Symbiodinium sp. CCMP2456]|nr:unnamed protein product [Symbiodinium sp. CCMP2456]
MVPLPFLTGFGSAPVPSAACLRAMLRSRTTEAIDLHNFVTPDRWCVTRQDLEYLQVTVKSAIREGGIVPPENGMDDFLSSEKKHGPSIYTVTEQHIKPVTALAGKMSWALMRNPNGLDCDLFISHAWQEGIFEFMSKVLHSWPPLMRHAWCCMLANPQHLDISSMLQSPLHSPFAIALEASANVLVVPNHHRSIYTRLWCAYEAYLAQGEGKTILIARSSNWPAIRQAMRRMFLAAILGMALAVLVDVHNWNAALNLAALCVAAIAAAWSIGTEDHNCQVFVNLVGETTAWFLVLNWCTVGKEGADHGIAYAIYAGLQRMELLAFASSFLLLEVDRVRAEAAICEATQLGRDYSGSIAHASCSRMEDDEHIRREIGAKICEVDYAIEVLMAAGISTPSLREIAHQGVNITGAAHSEVTMPLLFLVPLNFIGAVKFFFNVCYLNAGWVIIPCMEALTVLLRIHLLFLLSWSPPDEKCFILLVVTKLSVLYLVFMLPEIIIWESSAIAHVAVNAWFAASCRLLCCLSAEGFALLGIRRTAKLPCGHHILRLFFARSFRGYVSACARNGEELLECRRSVASRCAETDSSEESSTESEKLC